MSQNHQILAHLKKSPITPLQALDKYGCLRLAARINNLRDKGYNIETIMVDQGDRRFAKYQLKA